MNIVFHKRWLLGDKPNGKRQLVFDFEPPYEFLGTFFFVEGHAFAEELACLLDRALVSDSRQEWAGNLCRLTADKEWTEVCNQLQEQEKCCIATDQLAKLLADWQQALQE